MVELSADFPWLSVLVWLPALSALVLRRMSPRIAPCLGVGVAGIDLVGWLFTLYRYDRQYAGAQWAEHSGGGWWNYHLALDGVSVLFPALTALLAMLVLMLRRDSAEPRPNPAPVLLYLSLLLWLFTLRDLWLFCLGSALETAVALAWLRRAPAACVQFFSMAWLLLAAATLLLGWEHEAAYGRWSFDLVDLAAHPVDGSVQTTVLFLLLFSFAIRLPLFPLHGWFAPALQHAGSLGVAPVFIAGLKLGVFGLLRWVLPVLPHALAEWDQALVPVAVAGMFYGALLAFVQLHLGRMLAFTLIAHNAALLLGVLTLDREGVAGALLMSLASGLAGAGLLLNSVLLERHTGSLWLPRLGGLFDDLPGMGLAFLIAAITLMAMPGTPGFDAAHLLLEGTLEVHEWGVSIALASANVLAAGLLLWAFQRAFLAQPRAPRRRQPRPMSRCERLVSALVSVVLLSGFYSRPYLDLIEAGLPNLLRPYAAVLEVAP